MSQSGSSSSTAPEAAVAAADAGDPARPAPDPVPPSAARIFGSRLALAGAFADMLATDGLERGLIGPREVPRLWVRHLLNCGVIASLVPSSVRLLDVGSGAGLPGIVLAIARPDLEVTLVEPMRRRTTFLVEAVERLSLTNVTVVRARAEEVRGERSAEVVTARAVAPLSALLPIALPLVAPGGTLLAMKGKTAREELAGARDVLTRWPGALTDVVVVGADAVDPPVTVVRVRMPAARRTRHAHHDRGPRQ